MDNEFSIKNKYKNKYGKIAKKNVQMLSFSPPYLPLAHSKFAHVTQNSGTVTWSHCDVVAFLI